MTTKRWLNIVIDGNISLEPYWREIISNYLEKIVRCFRGSIEEEDAYLGLVFYNANSELGHEMQFINWTKDVNKYLRTLSSLSFNGNDINQYTMAEGLAHALVMYPKPSDTTTLREYYNAERHCILVAPNDPTPKKMMLCVPMIQKGQVVGQRLQACQADFLEVTQMFSSLAVSLSVITPNLLPIFRTIFNLGNNVATFPNTPISIYNNGQLTVLLSRCFQKAHDALQENKTLSSTSTSYNESVNIAPTTFSPRVLPRNLQEDKGSTSSFKAGIKKRTNETSITESVPVSSQSLNIQELVFPNAPHQENVASSSSQRQMNIFDDIMAGISAGEDVFTSNKRLKSFITLDEGNLSGLFEPDHLRFDDINNFAAQEQGQEVSKNKNISIESHTALRIGHKEARSDISQSTSKNKAVHVELTQSLSKEVNIQPKENQVPTSSIESGSSLGLFKGPLSNKSVLNATGNSPIEFQPHSPPSQDPMFSNIGSHYGKEPMRQTISGYESYKNYMTGFGPLNTPGMGASSYVPLMPDMTPTSYPTQISSPPSLDDYENYEQSWEGSLVGKVQSNRLSVIKAKASRKATTPLTLITGWTDRMEITNFMPEKAVDFTKTTSQPIDYVFFTVLQSNRVDLYAYLKSNNLCAKIDLPTQSIVLSPTEREQLFVGTIFRRNTLFIEPL